MEKSIAMKLIEKHRRSPEESAAAIARRAERIYLSIGLMFIAIALIDLIFSALSYGLTTYRISFAVIIFFVGALFCWQSYRFTRIRRLLTDAKSDSH